MTVYPADLTAASYLVIGEAVCFVRGEGAPTPIAIAEPIPSATWESLVQGIPTSYRQARAVTLGEVLTADGQPQIPWTGVSPAADFAERAIAAARTYQNRPQAQTHLALGQTYTALNHSTERKRLLQSDRLVRDEDNVKQHAYTHKVL
ncbi:MAG: hypothetical protein ACUVSQ_10965 [Pseudanabaenaceae cyanobacterium]